MHGGGPMRAIGEDTMRRGKGLGGDAVRSGGGPNETWRKGVLGLLAVQGVI